MSINNKKILIDNSENFIELTTDADLNYKCFYDKNSKSLILIGSWYKHQSLDIEIGFK